MKRTVKIIAIIIIAILALIALIPLWIGPVAKVGVGTVGPMIVKTDMHLGDFALNPYCGSLRLGDFQLSNPPGFSQREAFTLGNISLKLKPTTVLSDVVEIENIEIKDIFVSYVFSGTTNNVSQLMTNAGMNDEKKTAPAANQAAAPKTEKSESWVDRKKVMIRHFKLSGVLVQLGPIPISLPVVIELNDIGVSTGGITLHEAWSQIYENVTKAMGSLGGKLNELGKGGLELGQQGLDAVKDISADQLKSAVNDLSAKHGDKVIKAGEAVSDGLKSLFNRASEGINNLK